MLLGWLGERRRDERLVRAGSLIERAIDETLSRPENHTADLGGSVGTREFTRRLVLQLEQLCGNAAAA
jgi:isocitrate/isopropylmalate dehydrogenase